MLLFTIIFFAMVIVVGTVMIFGFSVFLKSRRNFLDANEPKQFADLPPYRSLFEPDEAEIRALELEEQTGKQAKEAEQVRFAQAEKVEARLQKWSVSPDISQTVELLKTASEAGNAKIFSAIAENVIEVWRENKIANLNHADLADLLDSHLDILPQQERFSGTIFWLRDEIKKLREKSE